MKLASLAFVVFCAGATAFAEDTQIIKSNGPVANRVNMVILGDGYRTQDLSQYHKVVLDLVKGIFGEPPYSDYARYFNIVQVDVISTDRKEGVSHPESGVMRNTALGAFFNCQNDLRLVCVDQSKVDAVLSRSVAATARDVVLIIVNDKAYGGAGGANAITSTDSMAMKKISHELGHAFGGLADEYDSQPPPCVIGMPPEPNVTDDFQLHAKWSEWVSVTTSLPTKGTKPGIPGAYAGAKYCSELFRPTFDSKMRTLDSPFEQINTEQLILRIYNIVKPIDSVVPAGTALTAACGGPPLQFQVTSPQPVGHTLSVTWFLDGMPRGTSPSLSLSTAGLSTGAHTLEVKVSDTTTAVRNDPVHLLIDQRQWSLTLTGGRGSRGPGTC